MLTEYDSPQSRALFRLLIGAAEIAKASNHLASRSPQPQRWNDAASTAGRFK